MQSGGDKASSHGSSGAGSGPASFLQGQQNSDATQLPLTISIEGWGSAAAAQKREAIAAKCAGVGLCLCGFDGAAVWHNRVVRAASAGGRSERRYCAWYRRSRHARALQPRAAGAGAPRQGARGDTCWQDKAEGNANVWRAAVRMAGCAVASCLGWGGPQSGAG